MIHYVVLSGRYVRHSSGKHEGRIALFGVAWPVCLTT